MHSTLPTSRLAVSIAIVIPLLAGCPNGEEAEVIADAALDEDGGIDAGDAGTPPECDRDGDQALNPSCGGYDCNDDDATVFPGAVEICSYEDEDCDEQNNEQLDCSFLAAGADVLYRIDPFAESIDVEVEVTLANPDHGMLDIDRDSTGTILAVTAEGLYALDDTGEMLLMAHVETPNRTNGMAIDSAGTIFITNDDGADSAAFIVNRYSGEVTILGELDPYESSGDCVTLKDDSLLMTATHPDGPENGDQLVYIDSRTAATTYIGNTGYPEIYGLSASFGYLFAVTDLGQVLQIDPHSGEGTFLFGRPDLRFWGAANGD